MEPLENPYAVLGLPQDAGASDAPGFDAELRKAYRKKALLFHPDKNVNKPAAEREAAAASYERVRRAFALLGDAAARRAFDELEEARREREARLGEQTAKRRRMVEELERRERDAFTAAAAEASLAEKKARLARELERLRRERTREAPADGRPSTSAPSAALDSQDEARTIRVSWRVPDGDDGDIHSADSLRRVFEKFGAVEDVVRRVKKGKGSALVQMANRADAVKASRRTLALGDAMQSPLAASLLVPEPAACSGGRPVVAGATGGAGAGSGVAAGVMNSRDFENVVLAKMRRAAERRRMAAEE